MHFFHISSFWFSIRIRYCLLFTFDRVPISHVPESHIHESYLFASYVPESLCPRVPLPNPTHCCLKVGTKCTAGNSYLYSLQRFITSSIAWFSMASGRDCKNVVYFAGSVTKPHNFVLIYRCRSIKLRKLFLLLVLNQQQIINIR